MVARFGDGCALGEVGVDIRGFGGGGGGRFFWTGGDAEIWEVDPT